MVLLITPKFMIPKSPSFVFFGTPEPAVEILEHLKNAGLMPELVVTNPDRPQGRKMTVTPPPVKLWAIKNNTPFLQPETLSNPDFISKLKTGNYQLFVVVAYGGIIPKEILAIPEHGSINVHYSLLPKYRGASPIESQILNDDRNTGVSIMLLDEKMDHGPILASALVSVPDWPPTANLLREASNRVAGPLLAEIIPRWLSGDLKALPQDHSSATRTRKILGEDRLIKLTEDPYKNFLKIRAFSAWGTYFFAERNEKKIRVLIKEAEYKNNTLLIKKVLPEGKKEMSYEDFLRGFNNQTVR